MLDGHLRPFSAHDDQNLCLDQMLGHRSGEIATRILRHRKVKVS